MGGAERTDIVFGDNDGAVASMKASREGQVHDPPHDDALRTASPEYAYRVFPRRPRQPEERPLNPLSSDLRNPLETLAFAKPNRAGRGSLGW